MGSVPRKFDLSSAFYFKINSPIPSLAALSISLQLSTSLFLISPPLSLMAAALLLVLGPRRHRSPTSGARQRRLRIWARTAAASWSCEAHRGSPPPPDVGPCGGGPLLHGGRAQGEERRPRSPGTGAGEERLRRAADGCQGS